MDGGAPGRPVGLHLPLLRRGVVGGRSIGLGLLELWRGFSKCAHAVGRVQISGRRPKSGLERSLRQRPVLGRCTSRRKEAQMRRILSIVVALSFLLTAYARGTVTISISGSGSTSNASPSSGQAFTLTASGGTAGFTVYADSSTDIGRITLTGSGTVSLLLGS